MRKLILAAVLSGLAAGPAAAQSTEAVMKSIEVLARTCNGCHGLGGASVGASMPSIGGLPRAYLERVMKQWKYGERSGITMNRIVRGFSDDEINALALYFSRQPWVPAPQPAEPALLAQGAKAVYATCTDCHGLRGGDPDIDAPPLNGQWAKYMSLEMEKYRSPDYKMPHRKMTKATHEVKPEDAAAAVHYFGAQEK